MQTRAFVVGVLVVVGCATSTEVDSLKVEQRKLVDRLEKLEARLDKQRAEEKARALGGRPDPDKVYSVVVGTAPTLGPADAAVTIVEFADFQCPFCDRAERTLKRVMETYGNRVRLVWKHNPLPFHNNALPAAVASECALAQQRFWPMHDALYVGFRESQSLDAEQSAQDVGLDLKAFRTCMTNPATEDRVRADMKQAAELGARGTPAFFINGRPLMGAQPFEAFKAIIDEELAKPKPGAPSRR